MTDAYARARFVAVNGRAPVAGEALPLPSGTFKTQAYQTDYRQLARELRPPTFTDLTYTFLKPSNWDQGNVEGGRLVRFAWQTTGAVESSIAFSPTGTAITEDAYTSVAGMREANYVLLRTSDGNVDRNVTFGVRARSAAGQVVERLGGASVSLDVVNVDHLTDDKVQTLPTPDNYLVSTATATLSTAAPFSAYPLKVPVSYALSNTVQPPRGSAATGLAHSPATWRGSWWKCAWSGRMGLWSRTGRSWRVHRAPSTMRPAPTATWRC